MMRLSDRELFPIAWYLDQGVWGGTEQDLITQVELWELTAPARSAVTDDKGNVDIGHLSDEPRPREMSDAAEKLVRVIYVRPGQPRQLGLLAARALARNRVTEVKGA